MLCPSNTVRNVWHRAPPLQCLSFRPWNNKRASNSVARWVRCGAAMRRATRRAGRRGWGVQSIIIRSNGGGGGGGTTRRTDGQIHNGSRADTSAAQSPASRPKRHWREPRGGSAERRREDDGRPNAQVQTTAGWRKIYPFDGGGGGGRLMLAYYKGREPRPSCAVGHHRCQRRRESVLRKRHRFPSVIKAKAVSWI